MNAYLDDQPLTLARPTLACAIQTARRAAEQAGRIIVEVLVNEIPVEDSDLDHPSDDPDPSAHVRLVSADPAELIATSAQAGRAALAGLRRALLDAADDLRTGQTADAVDALEGIVGTWQSLADLAARTAELADQPSLGRSLRAMLDDLAPALTAFRDALRAEDWAALADTLQYECAEHIQRWERFFSALAPAGA